MNRHAAIVLLVAAAGCATTGAPFGPKVRQRAQARANLTEDQLSVRWLGAAGFEIRTPGQTLLLDPFVSRPGPVQAFLGRTLSNPDAVAVLPKADAIFVAHSHYDHVMDVASIARRTGAKVFGSPTTCHIVQRTSGGRVECSVIRWGQRILHGEFDITVVPSTHSRLPLIGVPNEGRLARAPRWRHPNHWNQPSGRISMFVIRTKGLTIVYNSTAGLPADPTWLSGAVPDGADLVLAAIINRDSTPGYTRSLIALLSPRLLVPHHFENFFTPLTDDFSAYDEELEAFRREAKGTAVSIPRPMREYVYSVSELKKRPRGRIEGAAFSRTR